MNTFNSNDFQSSLGFICFALTAIFLFLATAEMTGQHQSRTQQNLNDMAFYQRPQINLAPFKEEIRILPFRGTSNFQQYQSAELVSEIMVFPNPTADHFNLKVNNDSQLAIVTDSGTLMKSQELNRGVNVIDVSNLRSGVYFIVISSLTESQTSRIIIER